MMVGCSGADEGVDKPSGRGGSANTSGSGGSSGSGTTGSGGTGGSTGGSTGTGGATGGSTGTGATGGTTGTGGSAGKGGAAGTGGSAGGTGGAGGSAGSGGSTGGTAGSGGSTGGAAGSGGSAGATGGTAGTDGGAGTGGSAGSKDGGVDGAGGTGPGGDAGASKCGAPLFGGAPTEASVSANGSLTVASYTTGFGTSTAYKDATVYYPSNGTGPYVVVAIVPGFTTPASLMAPWGRFMASHGYVGITAGPPSEADSPEVRANALWAVITSAKAENTRAGGQLNGKISDCFAVMGHSMGGGGSLIATNAHPMDIKASIPLNPYQPAGRFASIVGATLVLTGQNDTTASPTAHGRPHYDSIPATTIKQYVEAAAGNHQSAFSPNGLTARYAVSWLKFNVDGDARYRPFLDRAATGISNFATTVK
jgi:hypothetical protein